MKNNYKYLISFFALSLAVSTPAIAANSIKILPYQNNTLSDDERAKDLVKRMSLKEKVAFVTGDKIPEKGVIGSEGFPHLGMPNFKIEHGPFGFKGWYGPNQPKAVGTYFPVSIAQAATWDTELVERMNSAMGAEMKSSGGQANAAPAMCIIRDPRGGRSFEYFTEDPYLNGQIAAASVKGVQSQKVMANLKHFACNNQEYNRHMVSVKIDERALREVYLAGFETAIKEGGALSVMAAYNKINGVYCCENPLLLTDILRKEWGFNGFVLSDWAGTHSTAPSANAGLDLEMPNQKWYGDDLLNAVKKGEVSEDTLDSMVENILRGMFWSDVFDVKPSLDRSILESPEHLAVAREVAAKSVVLMKNDTKLLPLDASEIQSIAIIGPNGEYGTHYNGGEYNIRLLQGGGSASVEKKRSSMVTILDGINNVSHESNNFSVTYHPGCYAESGCGVIPSKYLKTKSGAEGLELSFYNNNTLKGAPVNKVIDTKYSYIWAAELPIPEAGNEGGNSRQFSACYDGILTPPVTREYTFELRNVSGASKMYINDKLIASNLKGNRMDFADCAKVTLEAGKEYKIRVEYIKTGALADLMFGWDYENVKWLEEAKDLASKVDVVILTPGLTADMGETEAGDRKTLKLPAAQERLINEIAKVNNNVVVSITAGSAIAMQNWMDNVPSIIFNWYAGQEGGNGIADVIFGKVNPSAKLPITFPLSLNQYPEGFHSLGAEVEYKEGVFVGYKYFDEYNKPVLFPFGYGLSYSDFNYSNVAAKSIGDGKVLVSVEVENIGDYDGAEVVQLYVSDIVSSVERPKKELKAFKKVELKQGEKKVVEFELNERSFAFWSPKLRDWTVEKGEYKILIGSSSTDIREITEITF